MPEETLIQKLREIHRTNDFHKPLEPLTARVEEVERTLILGRAHLQYLGFIGPAGRDAIETAIEVLFRCGDFEEVIKYAKLYGEMLAQQMPIN